MLSIGFIWTSFIMEFRKFSSNRKIWNKRSIFFNIDNWLFDRLMLLMSRYWQSINSSIYRQKIERSSLMITIINEKTLVVDFPSPILWILESIALKSTHNITDHFYFPFHPIPFFGYHLKQNSNHCSTNWRNTYRDLYGDSV